MIMTDNTKYAVVVEWKNEDAIVLETAPLSLDDAHERLKVHIDNHRVIRACIVELKYYTGNGSVLK
jgi:hypothetical protein